MTDPKPSTNDILARIRGGASPAKPADEAAAAEKSEAGAPPAGGSSEAAPAAEKKPAAAPAKTPSSTADILAAARAKAGGTGPKAAAAAPAAGDTASPKAPASAPKSPADIMAAIRGGGASAAVKPATASAASKPAAAKPAPAKGDSKKAAVPAGMSAVEMIRAAREGVAVESAAPPKVALPSKPLPSKAAAVKPAGKAAAEPRRSFLTQVVSIVCSPVVLAWTSFTGAAVASSLAVARFMMPNVLVEPPTKFKIGPPNDYAPGTVSTKWQAQFGVWIVNAEVDGSQMIYALSTVCTHLGCTPNWLEGEQKFKCPCHGSGFYKTGVNFEGPAPRPLERFGLRLAEDGMLEVDKSLKFQKELGQWSNSSSFVPVA